MKDKIMLFIIGVLVGAIISTGAFFVYTKSATSCNNQMQMPVGNPPSMSDGQNNQNVQPPEMPSGNNSQSSSN